MSTDINAILGINEPIIINNKEYKLKQFTVYDYVTLKVNLLNLINMQPTSFDEALLQEEEIDKLTMQLFQGTSVPTLSVTHLTRINTHLEYLEMKWQGFDDTQIKQLKHKKTTKSKYETGFLYILHILSNEKGWTHEYMMDMDVQVLYRYFGYWHQDQLREEDHIKDAERKQKSDKRMNNLRDIARGGN